ncbi:MAG: hypothetical protein HKN47_01420 [Pirellulaceae bacterium]|nr:hypothetical protein [Pirellulaceae bacterium]
MTEADENRDGNLDDAKLVEVAKRPTETQAMMLVAVLADAGIKAVATGGFTAGFIAEAPGWVSVQTLESDQERAKQVLSELKEHPTRWPED